MVLVFVFLTAFLRQGLVLPSHSDLARSPWLHRDGAWFLQKKLLLSVLPLATGPHVFYQSLWIGWKVEIRSAIQFVHCICEGLCYWDWDPFPCSIGIKGSEQKWKNHSGPILGLHLLLNDGYSIVASTLLVLLQTCSLGRQHWRNLNVEKTGKMWAVCVWVTCWFLQWVNLIGKKLRDQHGHTWAMDAMAWVGAQTWFPCQGFLTAKWFVIRIAIVQHTHTGYNRFWRLNSMFIMFIPISVLQKCFGNAAQLKILQIHMPIPGENLSAQPLP